MLRLACYAGNGRWSSETTALAPERSMVSRDRANKRVGEGCSALIRKGKLALGARNLAESVWGRVLRRTTQEAKVDCVGVRVGSRVHAPRVVDSAETVFLASPCPVVQRR